MHVIYHPMAFFMLVVLCSMAAVDVILCQCAISCTVDVLDLNQKILLPSDNYTARIREGESERKSIYIFVPVGFVATSQWQWRRWIGVVCIPTDTHANRSRTRPHCSISTTTTIIISRLKMSAKNEFRNVFNIFMLALLVLVLNLQFNH